MRKGLLVSSMLTIALACSLTAFAGGGDNRTVLKNPVVLIHGWAGSDAFLRGIEYFWGIEDELEDSFRLNNSGDAIYIANTVDAFNTDDVRGPQLRSYVLSVLAWTGASRVNIIGHSMGGTTSRYMVWAFGDMRTKVASISTVATPHRGTSAAHLIIAIDNGTMGSLQWVMDNFWGKLVSGDERSRFMAATQQLAPEGMASFNQVVTNVSGVRYFSYADRYYGVSPSPFNNILLPFYLWMNDREGANDGVVPVSSMSWGEYRGCTTGLFGVDHVMIVNHMFGITPGFDAKGFYVDLCDFLADRGL